MKRRHFQYSVSEDEVAKFVKDSRCIREFLNMYELNGVTFSEKAMGLTRFFRWLKVTKGIEITPSEFLNAHLQKTKAATVFIKLLSL